MALRNVPYRIHPLARIIAYKLYGVHVDDDPREKLSVDEILQLFSVTISRNLLRSALEVLRSDKYVVRSGTVNDGYTFKISHDGLVLVQNALRNRDSDIAHFHIYQDEALEELAGPTSTWISSDERLDDDSWRPLQIDRNDPEYLDTLEAVNEAIERIRGDNAFAEHAPEQRDGILATLESGLDWLKNRFPSKKQVFSMLIEPFWAITTRFRGALLAEVASNAARKLIEWLSTVS